MKVSIWLRGLNTKEDQDKPADYREEIQELPPSAAVDVMKAARGNRNAGNERRKRKHVQPRCSSEGEALRSPAM
jgi:hypothetical protein